MTMDVAELRRRLEGKATSRTDSDYETIRRSMCWNQLTPARYPEIIVHVTSEADVSEALEFARANGMKVAVRGGGHSWVGFSLRNGSVLVDLEKLNQVKIDREARTAIVQPAVTGRELNNQLAPLGLAFPVGHCPSVPMSGFLLSGGLGWNSNTWGPACFSVEEVRIVTADGEISTANAERNADLFWAARGGGPGFFGVITQFRLKLHVAPHAIATSSYYYPLSTIADVAAWTDSVAKGMRKEVELSIFIAPAPPPLAEHCRSANGLVGVVAATAFVDSESEAATLDILESCPLANECLHKELRQPTPIAALQDLGGLLWPEGHRYLADTLWSKDAPAQILARARDHFLQAPSSKSLAVCVIPTGDEQNAAPLPDAAFSITGETILLCYAIWERPHDDAANIEWHRKAIADLDRFAVGHYVGESDIARTPARATRCFAPENWQRLQSLRRKYDPRGLFHASLGS